MVPPSLPNRNSANRLFKGSLLGKISSEAVTVEAGTEGLELRELVKLEAEEEWEWDEFKELAVEPTEEFIKLPPEILLCE